MRNSKVQFIVYAAMIAAIYVVLTYFISAFNLVGCLLANLLTVAAIYDVIFGSLATPLATVGPYLIR